MIELLSYNDINHHKINKKVSPAPLPKIEIINPLPPSLRRKGDEKCFGA